MPTPDLPFDVNALAAHLQPLLGTTADGLLVERFKGGQSNPTYLLSQGHRRWVMRTKPGPVAKLLPSAHAIEREYRVMKALAATEVPVPRMITLCEDESVIGRAFFVMEHVQGRIWWDQSLPQENPATRQAVYDEMNRVQAALHRVVPAEVGLSDYGKPGSYFERQIRRWSQQYQASVTGPNADMDRLMQWLPEHMPDSARDDRQVAVVHGDYRMDNLMFHPTEPRVVAVLDWELSTLGHPLADFSYHCMAWHIAPGTFRGIAGLNWAELGIPSEAAYIERYCQRTGRTSAADQAQLKQDWNFYLAYNLFRMAAILQGIAKRVEDGTAASEQAKQTAAGARPLATLGWAVAQRT